MKDQAAAIQWAKALYQQTKAQGAVGGVQSDLTHILQSWRSGDEIWETLGHPMVSEAKAKELIQAVYGGKVNALTQRFMEMLAAKRRLYFLPLVAQHFERLADADAGIIRATVRSAFEMTQDQRSVLESSLAKFYQKKNPTAKSTKVILEVREDSNLIGGLTVKLGDWVLDHSLRSELVSLKESLSA